MGKNGRCIKLTFLERVLLATILPEAGSLISMILGRTLIEKVQPTAGEVKESGMKQLPTGGVEFEKTNLKDKTFVFEPAEVDFLKEQPVRLDKENKVTFQNLTLCEKIKAL